MLRTLTAILLGAWFAYTGICILRSKEYTIFNKFGGGRYTFQSKKLTTFLGVLILAVGIIVLVSGISSAFSGNF
jgi:hypothetical protein